MALTPDDLNNLKTDTVSAAEFVTSKAGGVSGGAEIESGTTRLGDSFRTIKGIEADAEARIDTVVAGANTAIQGFEDNIAAAGDIYPDIASGLAGSSDGDYFKVIGTGDIAYTQYRRTNASTEELISQIYNTVKIDAIDSEVQEIKPKTDKIFVEKYARSGYFWALIDGARNIALAVNLYAKKFIKFSIGSVAIIDYTVRSGAFWGVADKSGYLGLWLDRRADLWSKEGNISKYLRDYSSSFIDGLSSDIENVSNSVYGIESLDIYGDSLVEGTGVVNAAIDSFPAQLANSYTPARTYANLGFGGQSTDQICARFGGVSCLVSFQNDTLLSSGATVATPSVELLTYAAAIEKSLAGWIAGIYGTLTKSTSNVYTFTPETAISSDLIIRESVLFTVDLTDRKEWTKIIWGGTNDAKTTSAERLSIIENISSTVNSFSTKRFLVLGLIAGENERQGTQAYADLIEVNKLMREKFTNNFVDIKSPLVNAYDPNIAQDVIDFNDDIVPSSLRSDTIHPNKDGYAIIAATVKTELTNRGW